MNTILVLCMVAYASATLLAGVHSSVREVDHCFMCVAEGSDLMGSFNHIWPTLDDNCYGEYGDKVQFDRRGAAAYGMKHRGGLKRLDLYGKKEEYLYDNEDLLDFAYSSIDSSVYLLVRDGDKGEAKVLIADENLYNTRLFWRQHYTIALKHIIPDYFKIRGIHIDDGSKDLLIFTDKGIKSIPLATHTEDNVSNLVYGLGGTKQIVSAGDGSFITVTEEGDKNVLRRVVAIVPAKGKQSNTVLWQNNHKSGSGINIISVHDTLVVFDDFEHKHTLSGVYKTKDSKWLKAPSIVSDEKTFFPSYCSAAFSKPVGECPKQHFCMAAGTCQDEFCSCSENRYGGDCSSYCHPHNCNPGKCTSSGQCLCDAGYHYNANASPNCQLMQQPPLRMPTEFSVNRTSTAVHGSFENITYSAANGLLRVQTILAPKPAVYLVDTKNSVSYRFRYSDQIEADHEDEKCRTKRIAGTIEQELFGDPASWRYVGLKQIGSTFCDVWRDHTFNLEFCVVKHAGYFVPIQSSNGYTTWDWALPTLKIPAKAANEVVRTDLPKECSKCVDSMMNCMNIPAPTRSPSLYPSLEPETAAPNSGQPADDEKKKSNMKMVIIIGGSVLGAIVLYMMYSRCKGSGNKKKGGYYKLDQ